MKRNHPECLATKNTRNAKKLNGPAESKDRNRIRADVDWVNAGSASFLFIVLFVFFVAIKSEFLG
jgi:hypothetical protein